MTRYGVDLKETPESRWVPLESPIGRVLFDSMAHAELFCLEFPDHPARAVPVDCCEKGHELHEGVCQTCYATDPEAP